MRKAADAIGPVVTQRRASALVVASFIAGCACAQSASGEFVEFAFSGDIDQIIGEVSAPWDAIELGSPWSVTYVIDTEAVDQLELLPNYGRYDVVSMSVTVVGVTQVPAVGRINIEDESLDLDRYEVEFLDLPIGASGDIDLAASPFLFTSDALPATLDLDDFGFGGGFELVGVGWKLAGIVDDLQLTPVLPGAGTISALGVMMLGASRGRRRD